MMEVNLRLGRQLNHRFLYRFRIKALRRGVWQRIDLIKREIWRSAEKVLELKNSFAKSPLLISTLLKIIFELAEKVRSMKAMILKAGLIKAEEALRKYEEKGIFKWIPELRIWLKDPGYIEYLGMIVRSSRW